jgi:hypothetical protein
LLDKATHLEVLDDYPSASGERPRQAAGRGALAQASGATTGGLYPKQTDGRGGEFHAVVRQHSTSAGSLLGSAQAILSLLREQALSEIETLLGFGQFLMNRSQLILDSFQTFDQLRVGCSRGAPGRSNLCYLDATPTPGYPRSELERS